MSTGPDRTPPPGELALDELERALARMSAWIRDYLEHPERQRVLSAIEPGALKAALPRSPPREGEALDCILADFERLLPPALTHWNHPGFLAYFANTGSAPGILGEMAAAALNVNGMLWRTSPAATELEEVVLDWLRQALGLPPGLFGIITDTASSSSLVALAAARDVAVPEARTLGLTGRGAPLRLYASREAHSSIDKAGVVLGIGSENVIRIAVDDQFRMDPLALEAAITGDLEAGRLPFAVVATAGTTSTTSVDPVPAIAEICERYRLWLHVDAAYAGAAALSPDLRWALAGAERADSLVVNPHKWLFTPMDCSCLWTRRADALRRAFSLVPAYLSSSERDVTNYMDYGFQLGRRFRALKLWFVLRAYGTEGMRRRIEAHTGMASDLAQRIDRHPDLERLAPVPFSVVCFRVRPRGWSADDSRLEPLNQRVLQAVNAGGRSFLSSTRLGDRLALRIAIGNIRTTATDVSRALDAVLSAHAAEASSEDLKDGAGGAGS